MRARGGRSVHHGGALPSPPPPPSQAEGLRRTRWTRQLLTVKNYLALPNPCHSAGKGIWDRSGGVSFILLWLGVLGVHVIKIQRDTDHHSNLCFCTYLFVCIRVWQWSVRAKLIASSETQQVHASVPDTLQVFAGLCMSRVTRRFPRCDCGSCRRA